jgi:hypothetical protein
MKKIVVTSLAIIASPVMAGATTPLVTVEWAIDLQFWWAEGCDNQTSCGAGTSYLLTSDGRVSITGCQPSPDQIGNLIVTPHSVNIDGPVADRLALSACLLDCLDSCDFVFLGQPICVAPSVTFNEPVWASYPLGGILNTDGMRAPQTTFLGPALISFYGPAWVAPFRFTRTRSDFSADGEVDGHDLAVLLAFWGQSGLGLERPDLNDDGSIDGADLAILLNAWGPCP